MSKVGRWSIESIDQKSTDRPETTNCFNLNYPENVATIDCTSRVKHQCSTKLCLLGWSNRSLENPREGYGVIFINLSTKETRSKN